MSANSFEDLKHHIGHKIECVYYGDILDPVNIAIECEDCGEILLSFDKDEEDEIIPPSDDIHLDD